MADMADSVRLQAHQLRLQALNTIGARVRVVVVVVVACGVWVCRDAVAVGGAAVGGCGVVACCCV